MAPHLFSTPTERLLKLETKVDATTYAVGRLESRIDKLEVDVNQKLKTILIAALAGGAPQVLELIRSFF